MILRRAFIGILAGALFLTLAQSGQPIPTATGAAGEPRRFAAFSAPAGYIVHGIHLPPVQSYVSEIDNFASAVGKDVGIVMYFRPWDWPSPVNNVGPCDDGFLPRNVDAGFPPKPGKVGGRAVLLTWEPLSGIIGSPGPADYDNIINGQYNALIDRCADELKAWSNKTFLVRLMHEMNIADSPWWAGHSYNLKADGTGDTEKFKQAWRHVWQRFANKGVANVQWVWSPNYASNPNPAWNNMHNYYPGDAYVDWIGLDGYNWSTSSFQSYSALYDAVIRDVQCRYAKPIMQAEIGTIPYSNPSLSPSSTQNWIKDSFDGMETYPLVRAVVWFNDFAFHNPSAADFRVWTNSGGFNPAPPPVAASITNAYRDSVADSSFRPTFGGSQLLNPPMTRCAGDAVSTSGVLSARPVAATVGRTGQTFARFDIGALGLDKTTTFIISNCPAGVTCRFGSANGPASQNFNAPWDGHTLILQSGPSASVGQFNITISGGGHSVQVRLNIANVVHAVYLPAIRR